MKVYLLALAAGMCLAAGLAWTLRDSVAYADEPARPTDSTADLVRASVRGCVEGLGLVEVGVSEQVAVVRCRPNLGVGK